MELFDELAALAEVHAEPELLDHLAVYQDETMLLAWPDAFANVARLNGSLPASTVARLAAEFGCEYARVPSRSP